MASRDEDFLTLYVDPGEDTGWCLGQGWKLLSAGTEKLWPFMDSVWTDLENGDSYLRDAAFARDGEHIPPGPKIQRIVCEDFQLYPWVIYTPHGAATHALDFEKFRTVRGIGALQMMTRLKQIEWVLQPAKIKDQAKAAGAEELYYHPLHENRHQNDAIQHFAYYRVMEMM